MEVTVVNGEVIWRARSEGVFDSEVKDEDVEEPILACRALSAAVKVLAGELTGSA
jgi:hypothetical protein